MQTIVGAFEAKTHFSSLLEQVSHGQEIMISRHGKIVARLSPIEKTHNTRLAKKAITELRNFAKKKPILNFNWDEWKELRDAGRR